MSTIPVKLFQSDETDAAGTFLHSQRAKGQIVAAFLYQKKTDPSAEHSVGTLYVGMPETFGLTQSGHDAIKDRFHIAVFEQRNQIAVAIEDTEIESACELIGAAIKPY